MPHAHPQPGLAPRRPGFTLVELLMVIVIISLLMGILVVAIARARLTALDGRVSAEIAQLDSAAKAYQSEFGSYPISKRDTVLSTAEQSQFMMHLRRAFPRVAAFTTYAQFRLDLLAATANSNVAAPYYPGGGLDINTLDPAEALVFWLGGMPAPHDNANNWYGSSKLMGFNLNPVNPFAFGGQRSSPLFQFDESRLADNDNDGWLEYYPPGSTVAYTYFDARNYANLAAYGGTARPYRRHESGQTFGASTPFVNADSFQIIAAGQDNDFGANAQKGFPSGQNWGPADLDNLTNFTGGRLEDAQQ